MASKFTYTYTVNGILGAESVVVSKVVYKRCKSRTGRSLIMVAVLSVSGICWVKYASGTDSSEAVYESQRVHLARSYLRPVDVQDTMEGIHRYEKHGIYLEWCCAMREVIQIFKLTKQ